MFTGELSYRRLAVLIANLPPESATKTAVRDSIPEDELAAMDEPDGYGPWSHADLLLAAIADGIGVLAWQQTQIHGKRKNEPPAPIRRPGVARRRPSGLTDAQVTYLSELRERRRRGDLGG